MIRVNRESAVSETLGTVILIAVIAGALALVSVAIVSQPAPEKIPSLNADIELADRDVLISHNGGDGLLKDQMKILVDGVDRTSSFSILGSLDWSTWAIGDTLVYRVPDGQSQPANVQIIYTSGKATTLIQNWGTSAGAALTTTMTTTTTPVIPAISADFSGTPTSGYLPLAVQFTDASTGPVDQWSWSFGDSNVSSVQNPQYTYPDAGNYTVSLTVTNTTYGISNTVTKVNYTQVQSFAEYVSNESVFVYGTKLVFSGDTITGENATVVIMGSLNSTELNTGSAIAVNTIYVDGDVYLGSGSASLGYPGKLGNTYVNGDLNIPAGAYHDLYGNVSVAHNSDLSSAQIHGNMSVNGNVTLGWGTGLDANSQIYYTGTLSYPDWYSNTAILSNCIHQDSVPGFTIPSIPIPSPKSSEWYATEGYVNTVPLVTGMKVYSDSGYVSTVSGTATDVVIVAANGDIDLSGGGSSVSGVLFAPNGKVTFNGDSFEGVVIARDGLYVTSGGTDITFKDLDVYISDSSKYPF